jgi:N-acetylmuramic acid 6-phosphate etherase
VDHLETEARNPASARLDERTPLELVRLMNAEDARAVAAVGAQAEAIARAVDVIAGRLRAGGRLVYVGAGTSGRLGVLDAAECPPTFSSLPGQVVGVIAGGPAALTRAVEGAEDHPELAEQDLAALSLSAGDVLVGIATSGRTPYVLGAVAYARRLGAFTIGLACNTNAELNAAVDLAIVPVVGPEVLSGSTRLKAGTATKLVLNTLSTGAMVRLGKTYGNLMVDLKATNSKLRARTHRIVRFLTGLPSEQAAELLQRCGGELKTALVAQLAGVGPEEARARLQAAGGQVRQALGGAAPAGGVPSTPAANPASNLYLGVDGGGSHTVALLASAADSGRWAVLGRGEAGPSNRQAVGDERAFGALGEAVAEAFATAGLPRGPVAAACLGLAGAGRAEDRELVRAWARRADLAREVEVTTDAAILLAAGTPDGWGLALVAGTGSIAFGRAADGRSARAGGWGYLLGDEGSGYALALAGLRAVARAADGRGPATALTERLLGKLGLQRPPELVAALYGGAWDRTSLAALAPLVVEAAKGDEVAASVVAEAARELAQTAAAVVHALGWTGRPFPLALAGGALIAGERYRDRVLQELRALGAKPDPVTLVHEPAEGAVRLALAGGGAPAPPGKLPQALEEDEVRPTG